MKKIIFSLVLLAYFGTASAVASDGEARGVLRPDLVGQRWHQLPLTQYPDFILPLPWKTKAKYELRHFQPDFGKRIVIIAKLPNSRQRNDAAIISALDFSTLKEGEIPEQDCFYTNSPPCDGRLCEGLLIGVIDQRVMSKDGIYAPTEVWRVTAKGLHFEKASPKNVVCKPQSYAE
jgi:hypothetical protein